MLNGSREFCQEFLTDVHVPDTDRVGEVDQGWTVGTRWMFYEKSFGMLPFVTRPTPPAGVEASGGFRPGMPAQPTSASFAGPDGSTTR
jgi:hypothetical protein